MICFIKIDKNVFIVVVVVVGFEFVVTRGVGGILYPSPAWSGVVSFVMILGGTLLNAGITGTACSTCYLRSTIVVVEAENRGDRKAQMAIDVVEGRTNTIESTDRSDDDDDGLCQWLITHMHYIIFQQVKSEKKGRYFCSVLLYIRRLFEQRITGRNVLRWCVISYFLRARLKIISKLKIVLFFFVWK